MTLDVGSTRFRVVLPEGEELGNLKAELVDGLGRVATLPAWRRAAARVEEEEPVEVAPLRRPIPAYVRRCRTETMLQLVDLGERGGYQHRGVAYRCGSWRCRQCSRRLNARWYGRIMASHREEPIEWAFTLTFRAREGVDLDPDELELRVGALFKAFVRDMRNWLARGPKAVREERRRAGLGQYLRVVEWTRRAYPPIHAIMKRLPETVFFPGARAERGMDNTRTWEEVPLTEELLHTELVKLAQKHGFGWRGQVERIRTAEAAASYVTSHALKAYQLRPDYLKGFRRITKSRDFMAPLERSESVLVAMVRVLEPPEVVMERIRKEGGSIFDVRGDVMVDAKGLPDRLAITSFAYEPGERVDRDTGEVLGVSVFDVKSRAFEFP